MHITPDSHTMMSTQHYHHHNQQPYHPAPPKKNVNGNNNNIHQVEYRPENSIHHSTAIRQPMTTIPTRHPSTIHFLPTIPPIDSSSSNLQGQGKFDMTFELLGRLGKGSDLLMMPY